MVDDARLPVGICAMNAALLEYLYQANSHWAASSGDIAAMLATTPATGVHPGPYGRPGQNPAFLRRAEKALLAEILDHRDQTRERAAPFRP